MNRGLIIDNFAGGGGASLGIEMALARSPDIAINHDDEALAMHAANHPATLHLPHDVWKVDPLRVTRGQRVWLLWNSPDCKHHSKAKGGKPRAKRIRDLAWVVVRWAKAVRPAIIALENVEEFADWGPLTAKGDPCPKRKGQTFADFVSKLERLGYRVEYRELRAYEYGDPTTRKRLFLVARCDGKPILWPQKTHGKPTSEEVRAGLRERWRTAAEHIDWSLPCPSIFLTREEGRKVRCNRPLAAATMARVAKGVKRYVLDASEPFIVPVTHHGDTRVHGAGEPLRTVTTAHRGEYAVVQPFVTKFRANAVGCGAAEPLPTITANSFEKRPGGAAPLGLVAPYLVPRYGERPGQEPRTIALDQPSPCIVPTGNQGHVAAVHLQRQFGASVGSHAGEPVGSVMPGGAGKTAVAAAFLAQNNTGETGHEAERPLSTIVEKGCTQSVVAAHMLNLKGSDRRDGPVDAPAPAQTAQGGHIATVGTTLVAYYGSDQNTPADEPLHTATARARFAALDVTGAAPPLTEAQLARARQVADFLRAHGAWDAREFVTVGPWIVVDIGLRMLTARELASCQGFPETYVLAAVHKGKPLTKTAQIRMIGNSVCPNTAAALVHANLVLAERMAAARDYQPWGERLKARLVERQREAERMAA